MWKSLTFTHIVQLKPSKTKFCFDLCLKRTVSVNSALLQRQRFTFTNEERSQQEGHRNANRAVGPMGWFLLLVPITTFGLGSWQVKRRKWKLEIMADLEARTSQEPQELPYDLAELDDMEYFPVRVRGRFDHSREMYLGPRSLLVDGDAAVQGGVISRNAGGPHGYCVVTPFHLADRDTSILVNRGWVPTKMKNPASRQQGQVEGEVELVGVVRLNEQRAPFTPRNQPRAWFYRDLPRMAEMADTAPVFLDATVESTIDGGPIGGQTRISLRNEHLSYILTWYSLSAITGFLWVRRFIHGIPLM